MGKVCVLQVEADRELWGTAQIGARFRIDVWNGFVRDMLNVLNILW